MGAKKALSPEATSTIIQVIGGLITGLFAGRKKRVTIEAFNNLAEIVKQQQQLLESQQIQINELKKK